MSKQLAYKNKLNVTYYLYSKIVHLRGGHPVRIFFFNKERGLETTDKPEYRPRAEEALPMGYGVRETRNNSIPIPFRKAEGQLVGGAKQ